jgi:hypothetical protein
MFFIIISAVHVSGGFSDHHQVLIKLYMQPLVLPRFLLSTAGMNGLEPMGSNPFIPALNSISLVI